MCCWDASKLTRPRIATFSSSSSRHMTLCDGRQSMRHGAENTAGKTFAGSLPCPLIPSHVLKITKQLQWGIAGCRKQAKKRHKKRAQLHGPRMCLREGGFAAGAPAAPSPCVLHGFHDVQ
jgi:hypothetical protein